ncbi:MAG: nucleoside deaminase [Firmicutes bacterium]|nr:nucleoside deaminase [Bacillota bacterium]
MWKGLKPEWREAFALAWEAFCQGNVPVGCVIVNESGEIIAKGRNAIFEPSFSSALAGTDLAHAEMVALSQLQRTEHRGVTGYTLYTTLEPCPMCFGASVMAGIRRIKYAGRDGIAGSAVLSNATPYLRTKRMQVELADPELEVFQIALNTAFELGRQHPRQAELLDLLRADCPRGVELGMKLFEQGYFAQAVREGYTVEKVFEDVMARLVA